MEELFAEENAFSHCDDRIKIKDIGQSWEDINNGMRRTLQLPEDISEKYSQNQYKHQPKMSLTFTNKLHLPNKKDKQQVLKLNRNESLNNREGLKIVRSITQSQNIQSYRLFITKQNHPSNNFDLTPLKQPQPQSNGPNIIQLAGNAVFQNNIISPEKPQNSYYKAYLTGQRSRNIDKENVSPIINEDLNVIKEESFEQTIRFKSKSDIFEKQNGVNYQFTEGFLMKILEREENEERNYHLCFRQKKANHAKKYSSVTNSRDKLPTINLQNHFQREKASSLSIHASKFKQKPYLVHRSLQKNQCRYDLKLQRERLFQEKLEKQRMNANKKYRVLLNPRLSKQKLLIER